MIERVTETCDRVKQRKPSWNPVLSPMRIKPLPPTLQGAAQKLRILCLVFTDEKEHCSRAQGPAWTYTKKCDHVAFISSKDDQELLPGSVNLPHAGKEDYSNLWTKTKSTFMYAYVSRKRAVI